MRPDPVGPAADDPLRTFVDALPQHARRAFPIDERAVVAVHALARADVDLERIAEVCGRGTEHRSADDRRRIALYRLLRAAEQLEDAP